VLKEHADRVYRLAYRLSGNPHETEGFVTQTNLVSDLPHIAAHQDKNLLNPWGVSFGPNTPFWVSDNNAGGATLYDGNGVAQPTPTPQNPKATPLVVTIPGGGSTAKNPVMGNPTGQVFAGGLGFTISLPNGKTAKPVFIFVGEDGAITGWDPTIDRNNAQIAVDNSSIPNAANGAVYKGATLGTVGTSPELFVTNFRAGTSRSSDSQCTAPSATSVHTQIRRVTIKTSKNVVSR